MKCPVCGVEVEADAKICPVCGVDLQAQAEEPAMDGELIDNNGKKLKKPKNLLSLLAMIFGLSSAAFQLLFPIVWPIIELFCMCACIFAIFLTPIISGTLSIVFPLLGIAAIVLGAMAMSKAKKAGVKDVMAKVGLISGIASTAYSVVSILFSFIISAIIIVLYFAFIMMSGAMI